MGSDAKYSDAHCWILTLVSLQSLKPVAITGCGKESGKGMNSHGGRQTIARKPRFFNTRNTGPDLKMTGPGLKDERFSE